MKVLHIFAIFFRNVKDAVLYKLTANGRNAEGGVPYKALQADRKRAHGMRPYILSFEVYAYLTGCHRQPLHIYAICFRDAEGGVPYKSLRTDMETDDQLCI